MTNNPPTLNFSVILDKKTGEITLREGSLLTLKIPKHWQKSDTDTKNPALWVCHLSQNSWGINMISFYPTELEINKKSLNINNPPTYRGSLEITSENEEQIFYRCQLRLIEEKKSGVTALLFLLIFFAVVVGGILIIKNVSGG